MRYILLLFLFASFRLCVYAQDAPKTVTRTRSFNIGQNSVVKDSTGKRLTYQEWNELMRTRQYVLFPENFDEANPSFILKKKGSKSIHYIVDDIVPSVSVTGADGDKKPSAAQIDDQLMALMRKPRESAYFTNGQAIEPFSTRDINGNKVRLKELRGKVVVLNFWFIGCPACMQEIPELNKLVDDYKSNPDVVFLALALDENYDLKQFLKTTRFNYDIIGGARYIADYYKIGLYPTSVVLDKEGKVAFHTVGFAPNSPYWLHKTIDENLK